MTSLKPLRKVTRGVSMGKDILVGIKVNGDHIIQRGHVLSDVVEFHFGTWLLGRLD